MTDFYNDIDPYAAQWLENLIAAGHIPGGHVERRSIKELTANDLEGYSRVHLFAGIGGWPLAFRLAGFPANESVWSASFPCQPFSVAGLRKGADDDRHLWPWGLRLIEQRRPAIIFGEQVASKDGRQWLAGVRADLEALGYEVGASDLCAAGAGAPHIRQRLYWVAISGRKQKGGGNIGSGQDPLSDAGGASSQSRRSGAPDRMGDGVESRLERFSGTSHDGNESGRVDQKQDGSATATGCVDFWNNFDLAYSIDSKVRRIEPGTFPLAHGVSARVGKLRAYGNAIVPQVAAQFIKAFLECR